MGLGDGGGGEPHGGDAGAGAGAGSQVAGDGEGLRRQGREAYVATPVGEQPPLGAVDALGVVGEDGLQCRGHALVGGAQFREGRGLAWDDLRVAGGGSHRRVSSGDFGGPKLRDNDPIAILSNGGDTMANCFICQTELAPPMRAPHTVYVRKLFLLGGQTYCPPSSTT